MEFPEWVTGPTVCATRTFKVVVERNPLHPNRRNSGTMSFPQRPTVMVRHIRTGKMSTAWADSIDKGFEIVPATEEN
jgi:hypothetical protein